MTDGMSEKPIDPTSAVQPGWYPDPYRQGWVRWFDGSAWTVHAVPADESRPNEVVEQDWAGRSSGEIARSEWFPSAFDLDIPRGNEPRYNGGGGSAGVVVNRLARLSMRSGPGGPASATRWLVAVTVVLALLAWGDHRHRVLLAALASVALLATVVVGVRRSRERTRMRELGRDG